MNNEKILRNVIRKESIVTKDRIYIEARRRWLEKTKEEFLKEYGGFIPRDLNNKLIDFKKDLDILERRFVNIEVIDLFRMSAYVN